MNEYMTDGPITEPVQFNRVVEYIARRGFGGVMHFVASFPQSNWNALAETLAVSPELLQADFMDEAELIGAERVYCREVLTRRLWCVADNWPKKRDGSPRRKSKTGSADLFMQIGLWRQMYQWEKPYSDYTSEIGGKILYEDALFPGVRSRDSFDPLISALFDACWPTSLP